MKKEKKKRRSGNVFILFLLLQNLPQLLVLLFFFLNPKLNSTKKLYIASKKEVKETLPLENVQGMK